MVLKIACIAVDYQISHLLYLYLSHLHIHIQLKTEINKSINAINAVQMHTNHQNVKHARGSNMLARIMPWLGCYYKLCVVNWERMSILFKNFQF